jgi:hypothetical protein
VLEWRPGEHAVANRSGVRSVPRIESVERVVQFITRPIEVSEALRANHASLTGLHPLEVVVGAI